VALNPSNKQTKTFPSYTANITQNWLSCLGPLILAILFRTFGFLASKDFKIIWLSNLLTLNPKKVIPETLHEH
jgi:hypothetical protein